ncbi:hypothetical protein N0V94_004184 [Neodidymelliopsis sp. IMI 364377]|nr:hypothetical protein N0V94_004184 [Neodidymelliopsis sp. IMI 364377]
MPETPRFLIRRGKKGQAKRVLTKVYGAGEGIERIVNAVMRNVEREILEEEGHDTAPVSKREGIWSAKIAHISSTFTQLVSVGANRRALVIACMLQGFQQLCGFNSLMYFSATIFRLVGFHSPTLASMSIALTNFAFTLVAFWCVDRIGRRRMLLSCIPVMVLGLALCAVAFSFLDLPPDDDGDTGASHLVLATRTTTASLWPTAILLSMTLYVSSYASSLGCIPWQQSELFPLSVRSLGSSLATSTNWFSNTIVGLSFLPMMELLTPSGAFAVYALVCLLGWIAVWAVYPETAGLRLEEVGGLLREGYGVRESVERFRGRRK